MKHINYILGAFISMATVSVSCVDDSKLLFSAEKPVSIERMEYLNDYDALKSYVDRTANPGFKLGAGITASDYAKKGMIYRLANSNFDEVTAGNAMKYASCVKDDGSMDFSQVVSFVSAAKEAGTTIYGHTLAWHAQQNNKYLNSLLVDKVVEPDPSTADPALHIITPEKKANPWDWEIYYDLQAPLVVGQEYTISMRVKASSDFSFPFWPGLKNGSSTHYLSSFTAGKQWNTSSVTFIPTAAIDRLRFCFGALGGDLYFDDLQLTATGSDVNLIDNPSFDDDGLSKWSKPSFLGYSYAIEKVLESALVPINVYVLQDDFSNGNAMMGWGNESTRKVVNGVHEMTNPVAVQGYQAQAGYDFSELAEGTTYFLKMKIKGSTNGSIGAAFQKPAGYLGRGDFPSISFTTDWQEITVSTKCTGDATTRFLFNFGNYAGTIYIDDISIYWEKLSNSIPLTPDEKKEVLTGALDRWIKGMMEACDGYVKSWDVVNEPMSDGNTSELKYTSNVSADEAKNNFYWQDYLGKDYARIAIKLARQYGGDGLKLFINDYNLEAAYNSNAKCEGLINMVKYWESDGVTKIDGIGTQMHVTYALKPETQQKNEEAVVKMFQLLAASGKLIKISELDMGISDETGKSILTTNVTQEQHKAMSDYYKFIIKKYFELIPAAQRYGITQWAATDSPADSGWRKGEPIGLWDLNYNRKHTYAGFADGLVGK